MFDFAMQYADELELNRQKSSHKTIENVKEYVERKYNEDISLENVAMHIGLSSFHLSKMFKKTEGINFKEYVIGVRIRHAKLLLAEGRLNIGEIAQHVGYPNANYFSRAFKESCGVSPTEFSGRLRKGPASAMLPEIENA
jgi:two-component system response regulator YesN